MSETPADNPENNVDSAEEQQMHVVIVGKRCVRLKSWD